nr:MAG TPA: hypothetical protein [Caudoviricetes sp.]
MELHFHHKWFQHTSCLKNFYHLLKHYHILI